MLSLKVLAARVDEIARVEAKFVKATGVYNIGQGHWVKMCAECGCRGKTLCKV